MKAAVQALSDYNKIAVWVLKGNDRAIRFYERYGFIPDGAEQALNLGGDVTEIRMVYEK